MEEVKVLIVDDRDVIRDGLKLNFLRSTKIKVIGEASDGLEALDMITKNHYDVVLMDINMPIMNGIDSTKKMIEIKPEIKVLANSFFVNAEYITEIVKSGAYGFIAKGEPISSYEQAIVEVSNGSVFLSNQIDFKIYEEVYNYLRTSYKIAT
tara:strand:+ start:8163 stop:8618 length:456 start_codon:yes stop_codon:yes gene_type:complete